MENHRTAPYQIIPEASGSRFRFFCELSGAALCTTGPIRGVSGEEALELAWQSEGKAHFNRCHKCGRWVGDVMYNADLLECVDCAPWEDEPRFCPVCGARLKNGFCPVCRKAVNGGTCHGERE